MFMIIVKAANFIKKAVSKFIGLFTSKPPALAHSEEKVINPKESSVKEAKSHNSIDADFTVITQPKVDPKVIELNEKFNAVSNALGNDAEVQAALTAPPKEVDYDKRLMEIADEFDSFLSVGKSNATPILEDFSNLLVDEPQPVPANSYKRPYELSTLDSPIEKDILEATRNVKRPINNAPIATGSLLTPNEQFVQTEEVNSKLLLDSEEELFGGVSMLSDTDIHPVDMLHAEQDLFAEDGNLERLAMTPSVPEFVLCEALQ